MNAAELLVACLEREGVTRVFGLPGEETEELLFALRDSDVSFLPVRHEQGAAFMADVHGRLTGEAGVCLSTLGPGATNLLTGVADAHLDRSPLVAVTGQGSRERLHRESHQAIDVVDTYGPVTKWNAQLGDPDVVHEAVRKAVRIAEREKPGATHLELPEDVAAAETDAEPLARRDDAARPRPDEASLSAAADRLASADRPLLLVGNGAVRTGAADAVRRLASDADLPVVSTFMGKGVVPDDDPRSLMTLSTGGEAGAGGALERADLVVTVGYDVAEHPPAEWHREGRPVVHVDSEPAEVGAAHLPVVEIVADIPTAVGELADRVDGPCPADPGWYEGAREGVRAVTEAPPPPEAPFTVASVLPLLREALAPGDVLVTDVGQHKMTIAERYPTFEPNGCVISNGFASMGIAVPGALAADLAVEGDVVAATGDGGFLMNAAELETASRAGCGFTVVVFTDDDYRLISEKQRANRGEAFGTRFTNPDLVAFAESFGIDARRPTTPAELESAFETVGEDRLTLVDVPVE